MKHRKNILITGLPGSGKTTLITRLCDGLQQFPVAGFFTTEIREEGVRKGFSLVSLDGRRSLLSHVDIRSRFRVGKYGIDMDGFESFLESVDIERRPASIIVIDEIGKMECLSEKFRQIMSRLLDSQKIVVATIALKGGGFISQIKQRPDTRQYEITAVNRNGLVVDVLNLVERILELRKE